DVDDLTRCQRLGGALLAGGGRDRRKQLGGRTDALGYDVHLVRLHNGSDEDAPARAFARVGQSFVVERRTDGDAADHLAVAAADGGIRSEQLFVAVAIDPDVRTRRAFGERGLERGVLAAKVVAAHEHRAVATEDDPVLVDQNGELRRKTGDL